MRQPDASLPTVPLVAAPWILAGDAWIVALRLPASDPARSAFLPQGLAGEAGRGISLLMFVDYHDAPCGPYHELMFIPGAYPFSDGRHHYTISRILVSSWDSVVNGRRNWGIPKDRADFTVTQGKDGLREDSIEVRDADGTVMARLRLATRNTFGLAFPAPGKLVPRTLRTLAQRCGDLEFYYAPESCGTLRPGRVVDMSFNPSLFPDLSAARVLAAVKMTNFGLTFPVADLRHLEHDA